MKPKLTNQELSRLRFKYPWRDYQAVALDELETHLHDRKLHLVAPPGAGKTVLGLEVMRRLGEPSLVIVPTLAILTQWEDCLRHNFGAGAAAWISRDLAAPNLVTMVTYQGLYAAAKRRGMAELTHSLTAVGTRTVLLDEAHHLRNEWWRILDDLLGRFPLAHRISLTGTPPYDVDRSERARYHELCGEIDVEITIPELVESGDLCPHADFAWIEPPAPEIRSKLKKFHSDFTAFWSGLPDRDKLASWIQSLPFLNAPREHLNEIYSSPRPLVAAMSFLSVRGEVVPESALELFSANQDELPAWSAEWAEELLNYLFSNSPDDGPHKEVHLDILTELRRIGALQRGKVCLGKSAQIDREITRNAGKLNGVESIVKETLNRLSGSARVVVLSSSIHRNFLPTARDLDSNPRELTKIGVAPCFEVLRRAGVQSLALLTGTVVVIPGGVEGDLKALHRESFPHDPPLLLNPLGGDEAFKLLNVSDRLRHRMVAWTTQLFTLGRIQVLCGTQSLLGEGWDAPCINCLVIASNSGSFMLSNQIRGRAVRRDPEDPQKTSVIWHLATATGIPAFEPDLDVLDRRFDMFVGPHVDEPIIVSGLDRIGKIRSLKTDQLADHNRRQLRQASDSAWIRDQWTEPKNVETPRPSQMQREVRTHRILDSWHLGAFTVDSLVRLTLSTSLFGMLQSFAESMRGVNSAAEFHWRLVGWAVLSAIIYGPSNLKALWLILRFGKTSPITRILAEACHTTLFPPEASLDASDPLQLDLSRTDYGVSFFLRGGIRIERLRLSAALRECFGPIDSPRFLLRVARKIAWLPMRTPLYFPLPSVLRKREDAEKLVEQVRIRFGGVKLVDCRTVAGRAELLRARKADLFRSMRVDPPQELSRWE